MAADAEVADAAPAVTASTREPSGFLDLAAVRAAAEESGLKLPDSVYAGLVAALASGKHLVISGPAGSGKSTLALAIVKAAVQAGRSAGAALATASSRWTADDTVGRVGEGGFSQGHVLAAAGKKKWLLIDEIDRAQLDVAFGDLSSFLGGLPLSLPDGSREVAAPADWRIVATRDSAAARSRRRPRCCGASPRSTCRGPGRPTSRPPSTRPRTATRPPSRRSGGCSPSTCPGSAPARSSTPPATARSATRSPRSPRTSSPASCSRPTSRPSCTRSRAA